MKTLEQRIIEDGIVINNDILKVDSFINHQIDVSLVRDIAKHITRAYAGFGCDSVNVRGSFLCVLRAGRRRTR